MAVDIWRLPDFKINEREITNSLLAKGGLGLKDWVGEIGPFSIAI